MTATRVSDYIKDLKKIEERLTGFLDDVRDRTRLVPDITVARARVRWALDTVIARPDAAAGVPTSHVEDEAAFALEHLDTVLPLSPRFDPETARLGVNSIVSSTTAGTARYVADVSLLDWAYAQQRMERYRELQRPNRVRDLVGRVVPSLLPRFDAAERASTLRVISAVQDTATAAEVRTLLEGLQGELFELARHLPKENMTWSLAVERLRASAPTNAWAHEQVRRQGEIHGELRNELSEVLKRRRDGDLSALWSRVLDHIEALLTAVEALRRSSKGADELVNT